jgi:sporulation protein YlmC with PRC-barrel domain
VCGEYDLNFRELNWKKVQTSDGVIIGEAEGGEVDTKTWRVTHIHVGLNDATLKEFGLKKPLLGQVFVCLPVELVERIDDSVKLNLTLAKLKNRKECREYQVE